MPEDILRGKKKTIGFDPNLFTKKSLSMFLGKNKCKFKPIVHNLIDEIWRRSIKESKKKFFILPSSSVSEKYNSKVKKLLII